MREPLDTVSGGNALRYREGSRPFYENYFLILPLRQDNATLWVRYTVCSPQKGEGNASVWAVVDRRDAPVHDGVVALKKSWPLSRVELLHRERFIQIDENFLALESAQGDLSEDDRHLKWSLQFEDPSQSLAFLPNRFLYQGPFPKTKLVQPRLKTYLSGSLIVNHETFRFEHLPATQAHFWGTEYAQQWAWGHASCFEEDESALFEGFSAQIKLGPVTSPFFNLFYMVIDGETWRANKMMKWFSNKSRFDLTSWDFEVRDGKRKVVGTFLREKNRLIALRYDGPRGETRYCHTDLMSELKLEVFHRSMKGNWEKKKTLTHRHATMETVFPQHIKEIPLVIP